MMSKKGVLVVVSGFSGAGKGTLMRALMNRYMNYALSVSATTRAPREGEEDGREYFFKTREEFEQLIKEDALIEYAQYVGNYYGTPKDYVEKQLEAGRDVILEIEIQGALKVKEKVPDALLLFVAPPSAGELKRRLVGRGTETSEVIASRLQRAAEEAEGMERYDYLLINDELEQCAEEMHQVIQSQHHKVSENLSLIQQIGNELKVFMKGE
ncbi:guanylate kinase [Lactonifactor longoviformis DSM 17459]|uniref:Guanylate kinase n=2 Tax=Lactonifactor TaxID=420345 RepID=A0A1M4ZH30_9CLOT|nr:guanylate kinase [Lactonifactor longoviformis DSM 17459]